MSLRARVCPLGEGRTGIHETGLEVVVYQRMEWYLGGQPSACLV